MQIRFHAAIKTLPAAAWDSLMEPGNPFVSHAFLAALEQHACVGEALGWLPQHAVVYDDANHIIGAAPLYLKFNSYGEFVFDWLWAELYQRYGRRYYPKLVVASPYSPVPGPRLLARAEQHPTVADALLQGILRHGEGLEVSGVHCLFTEAADNLALERNGFEFRNDCQFHWKNQGYTSFDHFLDHLSLKKRKNIKQERQQVAKAAIRIEYYHGAEISEELWSGFHRHYCSTFDRRGGYPTLSQSFFQQIGQTMADQVVLFAAFDGTRHVASAFCLRDQGTLYGRHWGCDQTYPGLHFETCYYRGIDYCIEHGLGCFQPGAQGEHKLSRGFLPQATHSGHFIRDPEFDQVLRRFMQDERREVTAYRQSLQDRTPYKIMRIIPNEHA